MDEIKLNDILVGMPGITPIEGANLLENFVVVMHSVGHTPPAVLALYGQQEDSCKLSWADTYSQQMAKTYADIQSATERAAVCLSILLAKQITGYSVVHRSWKGTGFDYFLGDEDCDLFNVKARLEVSGIYKENNGNSIKHRFVQKCRQVERTDWMGLPAFVSIIEFNVPKAYFDIKDSYENISDNTQ